MAHTAKIKGIGVSMTEDGIGAPAVILEAREEYLPIFIGPGQAQAIEQARHQLPTERPMTHDLLVDMFTESGGAIDQIRIDDLTDNTFYAKIDADVIRAGERQTFVFDARPSDGLALAARVNCPITIADEVIDAAGQPPEAFELEDIDDRDPDSPEW